MKIDIKNYRIRAISILLSISLLCGLIPSRVFIPVTAYAVTDGSELSGAKIAFDFRRNGYADNTSNDARTYTEYTDLRRWAYVSDTLNGPGGTAGTSTALLTNYAQLVGYKYQRFVIKIEIPNAGRYKVNFTYYGYSDSGNISFYLIPFSPEAAAGVADYLTSEYFFDSVDTNKTTGGIYNSSMKDATFAEAGEYLLVFKAGEIPGKNVSNMMPAVLTFDGFELSNAFINLDKSEIPVGGTAIATAFGKMNDDSDATDIEVAYSSSNSSVATVDAVSGIVTAITEGSTNIIADVTRHGITKTATAVLTVSGIYEQAVISGVTASYIFRHGAYEGDESKNGRDYTEYTDLRRWAYVSDTLTGPGGTIGTNLALLSNYFQLVPGKANERVVLKIMVQDKGRYRTSLSYYGYNSAGIIDVYLIPWSEAAAENIANFMTAGYLLDSLDTYQEIGNLRESSLNDVVFDEPGEYLIVFCSARKNAKSLAYNMLPGALIFDGTPLQSVSIAIQEEGLGIGEKTAVNVTGTLSSGRAVDLSKATVDYSSSDTSVATINQSTGEITTFSEGVTDITVSVTLDGLTQTDSKVLQVTEANTLEYITLSGTDNLTPEANCILDVYGVQRSGNSFVIPSNSVKYTLIEENPLGTVEILSSGIIAGRNLGTAKIMAEVTWRGKQFESNILSITVREAGKSYSVAEIRFDQSGGEDIQYLNNYSRLRKWVYFNNNFNEIEKAVRCLTNCIQIVSKPGEWLALKAQIPEEGNYKATLTSLGSPGAGFMDIYLIPATDSSALNITNYLNDIYLVDQIDGYSEGSDTLLNELSDVYVPAAGEYFIVFKSVRNSLKSWGANMYPVSLLLEGGRTISDVSLITDGNEIEIGTTMQASCGATWLDGTDIDLSDGDATIVYRSSNSAIASINRSGLISAIMPGNVNMSVSITKNGITADGTKSITVTDNSELLSIALHGVDSVWVGGTAQIQPKATMATGYILDVPANEMVYDVVSIEPKGAATIDENGLITGNFEGTIKIKGISTFKGKNTQTDIVTIPIVTSSKREPTIWTNEKRDAVKINIEEYAWAENEVEAVKKRADKFVNHAEELWNMIVPEGLPRYYHVGQKYDPEKFYCRYCRTDLQSNYNSYPWISDPLSNPWKIKCPRCKRSFPSNDFGSYYKSGLDEQGIFNIGLAQKYGQEFLKNTLYPEKGAGWGVDDGFGYYPGNTYENGVVERHNYIAYYIHEGLWHKNGSNPGIISDAINQLSLAYVYTGEAKYGRTGAILLDRVADFYPGFDWYQWRTYRDDEFRGKILDVVWECALVSSFAKAYDAFFPIYDDAVVIDFLSQKAQKYGMENPKNSAAAVRKNAEDGILREVYKACIDTNLNGNFGMTQHALAAAALALNTMPETKEWLDWIMRPGQRGLIPCLGGNLLPQFVDVISRDGTGNEAAPGYNAIWLDRVLDMAEMLHNYKGYPEVDLYSNPKFAKMFTSEIPIILSSYYTTQIGDSGSTAGAGIDMNRNNNPIIGFKRFGTPELAQIIYLLNDNSVAGIHDDITAINPEKIQEDILNVIDTYGTFRLRSDMMTGYGFAALRDGAKYNTISNEATANNQRTFSMYFGLGVNHGHFDCLNLGVDAYGVNMAPDLGYPEQTGTQPNNIQWIRGTLSHNTVMVDGRSQRGMRTQGTPMHFDDSEQVKLMDIDATDVYDVDVYRRTVVMVKVDDSVSYGVDFFRIRGGNDHIYSFHSQSEKISEYEGLSLSPQVNEYGEFIGTYASKNVKLGPDPVTNIHSASDRYLMYPTGSTWLDEVRRDKNPEQTFAVDFQIKDYRRVLPYSANLHLRMTMLNSFNLTEVAIAHGKPPNLASNMRAINYLEYVLARRTGENLDTLYTTIYEPYKDSRYIKNMTAVDAESIGDEIPSAMDVVKAVKVEHNNGRIDYIIYSTNNKIQYKIDNLFEFRGFVGVYTLHNGKPICSYVNDGDIIGHNDGNLSAYTGIVENFTRELQITNTITVLPDQQVDPNLLAGKYIYVNNSGSPENGVYKILGGTEGTDNTIVLDIGDVTPIRAYRNPGDITAGYRYNIESGQDFRIPLTAFDDSSPIFTPIGWRQVDVQSTIQIEVSAESPIGEALTYNAVALPRGAGFDPQTRMFFWTPENNQVGVHHIIIEATDGARTSALHFEIRVLTATIKDSSSKKDPDPPPIVPDKILPVETTKEYIDLDGYDWAKDSIYSLTKAGIVDGTGENTYSPGANIKRADFALLLVRALDFTSESTESFSDIFSGDYYSKALAIAKANGIVTGVGGNRFNPTSHISRQDLMVIINRALMKIDFPLEDADASVLTRYVDGNEVSDYAKSAVVTLIKNGIIVGSAGKIHPRGNATRAEIAVLIQRIVERITQS